MEKSNGCICMTKQELIENNMNLVYFVIHKYYPTFSNDEDLKQVGMLGLCKAADIWDSKLSKFSTYAVTCIINEIRNEFRNRNHNVPSVSLETQLFEGDSDYNLHNLLPIEDVDFDTDVEISCFKKILTKDELDVVELMGEGMKQIEVAKELGITRGDVKERVRRIRRKWRVYNGKNKN